MIISKARARHLRRFIEANAEGMTDKDALQAIELFQIWDGNGHFYERGVRSRYEGKLYRCEQSHTSQSDWTPDITPAMWTEVAEPGEIPVWKQPTGATDAYELGAKVSHNGKHWISDIPANVYEPGVYGWSEAE